MLAEKLNLTWPFAVWGKTRVLLAVSGGADSVAMLRAMVGIWEQRGSGIPLIDVAHFNHGWRGEQSDEDEVFVRELCRTLGVRALCGRAAKVRTAKTEENARLARYEFLTRTAYECGARYVVTAHTANDRVETLLHNLFRGTGLAGAASPLLTRNLDKDLVLARPLIGCSRELVVDYLASLGQAYRTDASNHDLTYRRNFIRHAVLPFLREQYGEHLDSRLLSFSELAEESVELVRDLANDYLCNANAAINGSGVQAAGEQILLPDRNQLPAPWIVVREALVQLWENRGWPLGQMSRVHWEMLRGVFDGEVNYWNLPGELKVKSEAGFVRIGPSR